METRPVSEAAPKQKNQSFKLGSKGMVGERDGDPWEECRDSRVCEVKWQLNMRDLGEEKWCSHLGS